MIEVISKKAERSPDGGIFCVCRCMIWEFYNDARFTGDDDNCGCACPPDSSMEWLTLAEWH